MISEERKDEELTANEILEHLKNLPSEPHSQENKKDEPLFVWETGKRLFMSVPQVFTKWVPNEVGDWRNKKERDKAFKTKANRLYARLPDLLNEARKLRQRADEIDPRKPQHGDRLDEYDSAIKFIEADLIPTITLYNPERARDAKRRLSKFKKGMADPQVAPSKTEDDQASESTDAEQASIQQFTPMDDFQKIIWCEMEIDLRKREKLKRLLRLVFTEAPKQSEALVLPEEFRNPMSLFGRGTRYVRHDGGHTPVTADSAANLIYSLRKALVCVRSNKKGEPSKYYLRVYDDSGKT